MLRNPRQMLFFTLFFLLVAVPTLFAASPRPDCRVCGMWIDLYRHTRHVLTAKDGAKVEFCSLTCAARYLNNHVDVMTQMQVADYLTAELMDTNKAIYLIGSDAPPVMSNTSIIAFSSRERAEKFQQKHGGRILNFIQTLNLE